jgi:hypothetical protein
MSDLSAPFFLGGDGRSGTTLLSVMLDSHPEITCLPELHFNGGENLGDDVLLGFQKSFVARCIRAGIERDVLEREINALRNLGWQGDTFEERAELIDALGQIRCAQDGKPRWGMKIMREIKNPQRYADVWTDAKFVLIVRDPRDVYASQKQWPTWGYKTALEAADGFISIIEGWGKFEGPRFAVRYESLVENPEPIMQDLCNFLEIEWHSAVLRHEKYSHAVVESKVSHYSKEQVARPVNDSSIGRWQNDISFDESCLILDVAGDLMNAWDYVY